MSLAILIVDDQALVRAGFRMILEAEEDMEVVGEAADGREAVAEAQRLRPDVILMDVRMPDVDGIEATRRLLGEGGNTTKVVMLTTFDMVRAQAGFSSRTPRPSSSSSESGRSQAAMRFLQPRSHAG